MFVGFLISSSVIYEILIRCFCGCGQEDIYGCCFVLCLLHYGEGWLLLCFMVFTLELYLRRLVPK